MNFHGDNEEAKRIHEYLNGLEHNLKGEPIFRLVKANEQFEMREGTFNEFKGDLFVRTIYGIKKTPKYPQLKNCWILEQWFDPSKIQTDTVMDHDGYECIYSFKRAFEPLPLRLAVVQLIIKAKKQYRASEMLMKSLLQDAENAKEKRMDDFTRDSINDISFTVTQLHDREGISLKGLDIPDATPKTHNASFSSKSGK